MTFCLCAAAELRAQAPFFEGKTIRIVVGLPAADVYDIYARLLAQIIRGKTAIEVRPFRNEGKAGVP